MNICFERAPTLFGPLHITFLIIAVITSILLYFLIRKKEEKFLLRFLFISGIIMFIFEIWKQIFSYHYVFNGQYNMWYFPWQLCSMSMYCALLLPLFKKRQNVIIVFLATYSLLASIIALLLPYDMLRIQVLLTCHGFIYHIIMLYQALIAIIILRKRNDYKFYPSIVLFLIMAFIAEIVNTTGHLIFNDIHREPNMFYISPFYPTTQPVFNTIANKFGIFVEVIVYLGIITLVSYLIYLFTFKKHLK